MIRDIVQLPAPILRMKARKVHRQSKEFIDSVVVDLIDTATAHDALGLAAPQIGIPLRIVVVRRGEHYVSLVNPEVTFFSIQEEIVTEGCLSLPAYRVNVSRSLRIKYRSDSERDDINGLPARIIQHELDHLDGILIIDREVVDSRGKPEEARSYTEVL